MSEAEGCQLGRGAGSRHELAPRLRRLESDKSDILFRMRVSATVASRGFSALLTLVAEGETVEVDRHGQVVAVLSPPRRTSMSGAAIIDLVIRLPLPDGRFAGDVRDLAEIMTHPSEPWPS
jgi:antitoxin (DNA-binding transcriptional repressor) of toxin-antitoxin stability system